MFDYGRRMTRTTVELQKHTLSLIVNGWSPNY